MIDYKVHKHITKNSDGVINYMIYSHSTFIDILKIQIDYISGNGHLTLCIDKNDLDLEHIYNKFDNVVFYDSNQTYGQKLLSCIKQVDHEYILLMHDIDILYDIDKTKVLELQNFLIENKYDRVDFQLAYDFDSTHYDTINDDDLYLIKSSNTDTRNKGYIYNVNPSIWKRETLETILDKFSHLDYRTIEQDSVQEFSSQFNIFKLYSKVRYNCGYFTCLAPFKYLHITHSRVLFNPNTLPTEDSKDVIDEYNKIIKKYNL